MTSTSKITKQTLAEQISVSLDTTVKHATDLVNSIVSEISQALIRGDEVLITGFGKFEVSNKKARVGRNPATGAAVDIPAKRSMKFKAAKPLKDQVNQGALDRVE